MSAPNNRGRTHRPRNDAAGKAEPHGEEKIIFQKFFKSVGPRTYAAQVKVARNGNHFLVLTEGKRDKETKEIRRTRLFVFSEDFDAFVDLFRDAACFIKANPVPEDVRKRQQKFWANAGKRGKRSRRDSRPVPVAR